MTELIEIESTRLLLVEGNDDREFFGELRKSLKLDVKSVGIISYDGKDGVRSMLRTLPTLPGFADVTALGIVRDAHDSPKGTFQSTRDSLASLFDDPPTEPLKFTQSIFKKKPFHQQRIHCGVAILPSSSEKGELEDLLLKAVDDPKTMTCVEEYIQCLEAKGIALKKPSKTRIQTFLASREKAEKRLWKALVQGNIPIESGAFSEVRDFLSRMAKL